MRFAVALGFLFYSRAFPAAPNARFEKALSERVELHVERTVVQLLRHRGRRCAVCCVVFRPQIVPFSIDEAEEILIDSDNKIFQRGDFVVRPSPAIVSIADSRETGEQFSSQS